MPRCMMPLLLLLLLSGIACGHKAQTGGPASEIPAAAAGTVPAAALDAGRLSVLPQRHGTDGAFAARFRRRRVGGRRVADHPELIGCQHRWCFGAMQILRLHWRSLMLWDRSPDNHLTMAQRRDYLMASFGWFRDLLMFAFSLLLLVVTGLLSSGSGFALENRMVISKVFPSIYRDSQVHRVAPFFRAMRATLNAVAPAAVANPRVVVLTPGPLNETYFEHAYLSTYLGYSLVEGADLTVRDGRVWLRSLGGLEPVDVILRRVDSSWCDPLELRPSSQLGVPGLLEAALVETPDETWTRWPWLLGLIAWELWDIDREVIAHIAWGRVGLLPQPRSAGCRGANACNWVQSTTRCGGVHAVCQLISPLPQHHTPTSIPASSQPD